MILLRNSLLQKCVPEQMSWLAAEREILCTTKKFVKSVSAWITSQPPKNYGKSSAYFLSLFLYWCDATSWRVVRRCTFHQELKEALHFTCLALRVDRTTRRNCSVSYSSWIFVVVFLAKFITRELAFGFLLRHGYLKWLKTEVVSPGSDASEREINWTLWLVSWLKHECRLAVAQPTSQTKKGTRATGCWQIWCPRECMGSKKNSFFLRESIVIWPWV